MIAEPIRLSSAAGRWVLVACVTGSGLAGIDSTVVNIALPDIGRDLGAGFATLQWTVTAYTLTLASFILLGGALGDRFGRRRIFVIGVVWFAVASVLCAVSPSPAWLIAARALQGIGGALLTPASLAIIEATFADQDRSRAVGAWSGLSGTASAIAPLLGGWLLAAGSWHWVFLINPPLALIVVVIALRHMPETWDTGATGRVDVAGSALCVVGLGGLTAGLIGAGAEGFADTATLGPLVIGIVGLIAFVLVERRQSHPMLPLSLFRYRQFSAANAVTALLYAANGGALLLLVIALQTVAGFSPLLAGSALLPITVIMLLLAARFGALAGRIGPRRLMAIGPLISAVGLALMTRLGPEASYVTDALPAMVVFGLGLAVFVAPLTSTALSSVPAANAGIASGVNNAVARAAGLIAIAALPVLVGLSGSDYEDPTALAAGFRAAIWICVGLHLAAGLLAALTIRDAPQLPRAAAVPAHSVGLAGDPTLACHVDRLAGRR